MSTEQEPERSEEILDNVGNLDTARMTLRWALERIRNLEGTMSETQNHLRQAFAAREAAVRDLEDYRKSVGERVKQLEGKERFVTEMQGILNDLFKGDLDVSGFVKRREQLEESYKQMEAKLRRRVEEAESSHGRELEENNRRLAEMEAAYTSALSEAQKRYHEQMESLQREQEEALEAERRKYADFREEAAGEVKVQADEYQAKLVLLEVEHSRRRKQLREDFERLKTKLLDEHRVDAERHAQLERHLTSRWDAERSKLEERIAQRERHIGEMEKAYRELEQDFQLRYVERTRQGREMLQAVQDEFLEELESRKQSFAEAAQSRAEELEAARAALRSREEEFAAERLELLRRQDRMREEAAAEYERALDALKESAATSEAEHVRRSAEQVESLRGHYEELQRGEREENQKLRASHAEELASLRKGQTERFESALRELERSAADRAQEQSARHSQSLRDLETRFSEEETGRREQAEADLEAMRRHYDDLLVKSREERRRQDENAMQEQRTIRSELLDIEKRHEDELRQQRRRHQEELLGLRKSLEAETKRLRSELEVRERNFAAECAKLQQEPQRIREEELRKREAVRQDLEGFFIQRQSERVRDTAEQLEAMRRHYGRTIEALRRELQSAGSAPKNARPQPGPAPVLELPRRDRTDWLWWLLAAACVAACAGAGVWAFLTLWRAV